MESINEQKKKQTFIPHEDQTISFKDRYKAFMNDKKQLDCLN